jgi:transcription elongation factor Elf1
MKLIKMECPYCGAQLQIEEGQKTAVCPYCGQSVTVDDEKKESIVTIKDEAKLKEAELHGQQYQEQLKERQREEQKAFRKGKEFKFIIILLIVSFIGALAGFGSGHTAAGVVSLIQIALLTLAIMAGNGMLASRSGRRLPSAVFVILACVLAIPFFMSFNQKEVAKDKLVWPSYGLAERLPVPDSEYGNVIVNNEETLSVRVEDFDEQQYQEYLTACRDNGFSVDAVNSTSSYEAADADGYVLRLASYSDSMSIHLDAPETYTEFTWPVRDLAAALPAPPVSRGAIQQDTSTCLDILIPEIDADTFTAYVEEVLAAGFDQDYQNSTDYFSGTNADGISVSLRRNTGNVMEMMITVEEASPSAEAETPVPTETAAAEATVEAIVEATAEATAAASGIRPEFKEAMDSYAAFFDSYCEFMESYDSSDAVMAAKYLEFVAQASDTMAKMDAIDESELTPEEEDYYLQTLSYINQRMLEAEQNMN